jgi:hypothetical protein
VLIELLEREPAAREGGAVLRALRDDAEFPYVAIAPGDAYDVAFSDGEPDGGGVVLVEPFAVPPGDDEPFLAAWRDAHAALATNRGYLGTRLWRAVAPATEPRWIEVARWSSPLMVARALEGAVLPPLYLPIGG